MSEPPPDDEIEINLRDPREVAERCIVLGTLSRRVWLESSIGPLTTDELAAEAFDLREWLRTEGLWDKLTASEREILDRPAGQLDPEAAAAAVWHTEGLATLGWSLGLSKLLPLGESGDLKAVIHHLPTPWDQTSSWSTRRELKSETDIARERERAEVWHWRIEVETLRRATPPSERVDLELTIRQVSQEAHAAGLLEAVVNEDLAIDDRSLSSIGSEELDDLAALTTERLRALNWLCGFGESWDTVSLDV